MLSTARGGAVTVTNVVATSASVPSGVRVVDALVEAGLQQSGDLVDEILRMSPN
jgi:hypothetical protein